MRLIPLPPADRASIDGLLDLGDAGGSDRAVRLVEPQTLGLPFQATKSDEFTADRLLVVDQVFVAEVKDRHWQDGGPMRHQPLILTEIQPEMTEVESKRSRIAEVLEVAGQTGVDRIAPTMDDPGFGEQRRDKAEVQEIKRHLVNDSRRVGVEAS